MVKTTEVAKQLGSLGGKATLRKYGKSHCSAMGKKSKPPKKLKNKQ